MNENGDSPGSGPYPFHRGHHDSGHHNGDDPTAAVGTGCFVLLVILCIAMVVLLAWVLDQTGYW